MIFLSAGHQHKAGNNYDPGAVGNGVKEADLTAELRDLTTPHLKAAGANFTTDRDSESLSEYLKRIQPGEASVVCEIHFNASSNPKATGVEVVIPSRGSTTWEGQKEAELARQIAAMINYHTGIVLRANKGVIGEAATPHKSLGLMRESGINVLIEVCFIYCKTDLIAYNKKKVDIAKSLAALLIDADGWKE